MYVCIHVNTAFSHICCKEGPEKERKNKRMSRYVNKRSCCRGTFCATHRSLLRSLVQEAVTRNYQTTLFFLPPPFLFFCHLTACAPSLHR